MARYSKIARMLAGAALGQAKRRRRRRRGNGNGIGRFAGGTGGGFTSFYRQLEGLERQIAAHAESKQLPQDIAAALKPIYQKLHDAEKAWNDKRRMENAPFVRIMS